MAAQCHHLRAKGALEHGESLVDDALGRVAAPRADREGAGGDANEGGRAVRALEVPKEEELSARLVELIGGSVRRGQAAEEVGILRPEARLEEEDDLSQ